MVAEHSGARRRGFWTGLMQLGSPIGFLLSTLAVMLVTLLPNESFESWGWRIPFIASAALLAIGLYVRLSVVESPVFEEAAAKARRARHRRCYNCFASLVRSSLPAQWASDLSR